MAKVNTLKIKDGTPGGFMVINESDFDQAVHKLYGPNDVAHVLPMDTTIEIPVDTESLDNFDKDYLISLAGQMNLDVDKRWSVERIKEKIKESMDQA